MLGFTGTWQGHRVSVQGSGMGQPSMAIYVNELFREYDVQPRSSGSARAAGSRSRWPSAT